METAVYSWTDDLKNNSYSEIEELNANDGVGVWTEDGGVEASYPTKSTSGVIVWMPRFKAWPDVVHLTPGDFPLPFIAILSDCRLDLSSVQYQWVTSDSNINIVSPTSQETLVDVGVMPKWDQFDLSVTAKIANRLLCSTLQGITYGVHEIPMVSCSVSVPRVLILKDKQMEGSKPGTVTVTMLSDIPTNGVVRISLEDGGDKISTSLNLPQEFAINEAESFTKSFFVDGIIESDVAGDVRLKCEFVNPFFGNTYPPIANDWARGTGLGDWIHLGSVYPEPGFIAGRFNSTAAGHCGIVDYDGWTISARENGISRNAEKMLDGSVRYNKPLE
jgi:hypothetical protein